MTPEVGAIAAEVVAAAKARGWMIATAESCTGGLVAGAITEIAGSSAVLERGFVTYSNEAKSELLGVPPALIARHGAVSEEVARAMAEGAVARSRAHLAISITGIAGPAGGSAEKPVGLVHFATATRNGPTRALRQVFTDNGRSGIRAAATRQALLLLREALQK